MTERQWAGFTYDYFSDAQATEDTEYNEGGGRAPQEGTMLVGCPLCGIDFKKPRPIYFDADGRPKCIMQNNR